MTADSGVFLALLLLFFCSTCEVSSEFSIGQEITHFSQAFHVFTRASDQRLVNGIGLGLPKNIAPAPAPAPPSHLDCGGLCNNRCGVHSRPKVCIRACGTCCKRCKCVPPGTFGNREMCGKCYTDMTTHGNRTKCP